MTDRELLEKAAKAAGYVNAEWQDMEGWGEVRYGMSSGIWTGSDYWNPLTDDGDALRLAVALRLVIDAGGVAPSRRDTFIGGPDGFLSVEPHDADPHAATRRAIVRAAAAIGEAK